MNKRKVSTKLTLTGTQTHFLLVKYILTYNIDDESINIYCQNSFVDGYVIKTDITTKYIYILCSVRRR